MTTNILALILILSVIFFGTVELWSSSVILFLIFSLGLFWIFRGEYRNYKTSLADKLLLSIWACFICYGIFQFLPLPSFLVKLLSPSSSELQTFYSLDKSSALSISLSPYATLTELLKIIAFFVVFTIALYNFRNRDNLTGTVKILLVFGFVLAIFAIVQKATWTGEIYWFRKLTAGGTPFGPFVNRNHFAGFAGMLIPLGLGITFIQKAKEKKILFGFITVIITVSLFLSLSRGGIIGFFSGIGLFTVLMIQSRVQAKKIWVIGIFLAVLASYLIYLGIDPIIERFYKTDVTGEERLVVWSATWLAFTDFWFTGSGLGTFIHVFPLYSPPAVQSIYNHAHNDYLEFILENGMIGTILLTGFMCILIYSVIKSSRKESTGILRIASVSSLFTMAVHSIFDFNLHILSNALMFSLVLGMVAALSQQANNTDPVKAPVNKSGLKDRPVAEDWQNEITSTARSK